MAEHKQGDRVSKPNRTQIEEIRSLRSRLARFERNAAERGEIEGSHRALVDNSAQGLTIIQDTRVVFANQKMAGITGYGVDELKAMSAEEVQALIPLEDRKAVWSRHRDRQAGRLLPGPYEFRIVHRDGSVRWLEAHASLVRYQGHPAVQSAYVDITDRKQTEKALTEECGRAQTYLDLAGVMFVALDAAGTVTLANRKACEVLGYAEKEIVGRNWFDACLPHYLRKPVEEISKRLMRGQIEPVEYYENAVLTKSGAERLIAWHNTILRDDKGSIIGILSSGQDITERKRAEEKLERQQYYLSKAQEIGSIGAWKLDIRKNILTWTDENYRVFGVPLGTELNYEIFLNCIHPDDRDYVHEKWNAALNHEPYDIEHRLIVDGEVKWVREKAEVEFDEAGRAVRGIGFTQDITLFKQAEEVMAEANCIRTTLIEALPYPTMLIRRDKTVVFANRIAREVGAVVGGRCWRDFGHSDHISDEDKAYINQHKEEPPCGTHCTFCLADEALDDSTAALAPEIQAFGGIWEMHWIPVSEDVVLYFALDLTERRQAEEARLLLETGVEQAAEAVVITDAKAVIQYVNPAFEKITGYTRAEVLGQNPRVLQSGRHDQQFYKQLWATLESGGIWRGEFTNRCKDGTEYQEEATISPVSDSSGNITNYIAVKEDITERRRAERLAEERQAELLHVSRLSTLGEMASGLAHELNQPLFAIGNLATACLHLARADGPDMGRISRDLEEIVRQGDRARDVMGRIRAFAQRRQPHLISIDLNQAVANAVALLSWEIRQKGIDVNLELDDQLLLARADAVQIEQVLLNLARNAVEAMEETAQELRCLTIRTRASDEGTVRVEVSDTGVGLPNDDVECVFDAFFTTKADGLGIGLSISRTIIEMHNGTLEARRNTERGSTFVAVLPAIGIDRHAKGM